MDDSPRASKRRKIDTPKRTASTSSPATKPTTRKASGRLARQSGSNTNGENVSDVEEEPAKQRRGRLAKGATNATSAKPAAVEDIDVYDDIEGALNIKPSSRPTRRKTHATPKETTASVGHVAEELQESTTPKRGNTKPTPTPKRRAADDEWDIHRDDILNLYVEENKPLSEVITTMTSQQGFKKTYVAGSDIFRLITDTYVVQRNTYEFSRNGTSPRTPQKHPLRQEARVGAQPET
jgi:hypothetical protein